MKLVAYIWLYRVQSNATYRPKVARTGNTTVPVPTATSLSTPEQTLLKFLNSHNQSTLTSPTFKSTLQQVKSKLYDKDYEAAFGTEEYRRAYEARWVPSRAIIYRRLMRESATEIKQALFSDSNDLDSQVVMIGGGAGSELCALASILERLPVEAWNDPPVTATSSMTTTISPTDNSTALSERKRHVSITIADSADWSTILSSQHSGLLSSFPSLENRLSLSFTLTDVLNPQPTATATATPPPPPSASIPAVALPFSTSRLTTILFTISELFLQSRSQTLALLSTLSSSHQPGSLLLIVESASLSQVPIGTSGRSYPLGMLLDSALAQDKSRDREGRAKWECLEAEDQGKWIRLPSNCAELYANGAVKLENTRVVMRLYRRL